MSKVCTEKRCAKRVQARDLCAMHYSRVLRIERGVADPDQNQVVDPVAKITGRCEIGLCWTWKRGRNSEGYGVIAFEGQKWYVHRLLWTLLVGPIQPGLEVDHLCKNVACCNPDHLEPVSPRINKLRGASPSAEYARRTACKAGHTFMDAPPSAARNGARKCITCEEQRRTRRARARVTKKQETN